MTQHQNEKETLLCTHGDCKELQSEDGEYCDKHAESFISTYKLIDNEGGELMRDDVFKSKHEVLERLRAFHSVDVENTEQMSLNTLLEIGNWSLVENTCSHEDEVIYEDLLQIDGEPYYIVKCQSCGEYGTIKLVESDNEFGLTEDDAKKLVADNSYKSELSKEESKKPCKNIGDKGNGYGLCKDCWDFHYKIN